MNFLYPLLWLGTLAIAVPIWLHLRRKPDKNIIHFSTLRFLEDQPMARRSPLNLRHFILFMLRILAVLLLVAAFAWPYIRPKDGPRFTESRVHLLDNTSSRQVEDGFMDDRNRLLKEIAQSSQETQHAVIELTAQPRVIVHFGDDRGATEQKLRALKPSFQRGSYLAAFRQAGSLLGQSIGEHKKVIVYSDGQENQWNENLHTPPFLKDIEVVLAQTPSVAVRPNLYLTEPMVQRVFLGDKAVVQFVGKLGHQGETGNATVVLRVNQQEIFRRAIDLANQPEMISLAAQWASDATLWLEGEFAVEGSPDAMTADNKVYFSCPPLKEGRVALVAQSTFLRAALSPEVVKGKWDAHHLQPMKLADALAVPVEQDADVLVMEAGYLQSVQARSLVLRYLNHGRGVFMIVDRMTPLVSGFLMELGFQVSPPEKGGEFRSDAPGTFRYFVGEHPILNPFISPEFGNLMDIRVSGRCRLSSKDAVPLIFSQSGDGLLFQGTRTKGVLLVCGFGFNRSQTDWVVHPTFVPFLDLCLQYLRPREVMQTSMEPGELWIVKVPPDHAVREVVLSLGGVEVGRARVDEHQRAQLRVPDQPALYALTCDSDKTVQQMLSVNPSPRESQLTYVTGQPDAIKAWKLPPAPSSSQIAGEGGLSAGLHMSLQSAVLQQRLWWWLCLGGMVALGLEMLYLVLNKEHS